LHDQESLPEKTRLSRKYETNVYKYCGSAIPFLFEKLVTKEGKECIYEIYG